MSEVNLPSQTHARSHVFKWATCIIWAVYHVFVEKSPTREYSTEN